MIRRINNNYMDSVAGGMRFEELPDGTTNVIFENMDDLNAFINFLDTYKENEPFYGTVAAGSRAPYSPHTVGAFSEILKSNRDDKKFSEEINKGTFSMAQMRPELRKQFIKYYNSLPKQ